MISIVTPNERGMLNDAGDRMPLGALYLAAALDRKGFENQVIDLNHTHEDIALERLADSEIVCLSVMSPTAERMKKFANRVRNYSAAPIMAGGFHVTNLPGDMKQHVDHEFYGYGESELLNYLDDLGQRESFDINRYPIPARSKLNKDDYNFTLEGIPATTMITSRGCLERCIFCSNFDKNPKQRDLRNIEHEIEEISKDYGAVYLVDDSFLADPHWALKVMTELGMNNLAYRIEARADHINDYSAELLGETGCRTVGMGIESGNNEILRRAGKRETTEDIRRGVKYLGDEGVKTKGFFIIGLPGETRETARQTIDFADSLRRDGLAHADFYPLCPYPGAPVFKRAEAQGIEIIDPNYSHYLNGGTELYVPTQTKDLKSDEIRELIMEARDRWS